MADNTHIEWTDATWNPVAGCSVVSPGCTNCYAMRLAGTRLRDHPSRAGLTTPSKAGPVWNGEVRFNEQWLDQPLRWKRPRRIFVCAHGDLFHESVPDAWIDRVFAVMALSPQHTFQVLTKRAGRMRAYVTGLLALFHASPAALYDRVGQSFADLAFGEPDEAMAAFDAIGWPLRNVWLGVSAEDQTRADERIPDLLATPAAGRFVSLEPMLGPVNIGWAVSPNLLVIGAGFLRRGQFSPGLEKLRPLDWVILGGESGPGSRPMHPDWARQVRDDCAAAGVAFFFKQWGDWVAFDAVEGDTSGFRYMAANGKSGAFLQAIETLGGAVFESSSWFERVGKAAAGRLLDGVTHDAMPGVG